MKVSLQMRLHAWGLVVNAHLDPQASASWWKPYREYNVWLELVLFGVKRVLGLHAMPTATEMDSRVQRQCGLFNCFPT